MWSILWQHKIHFFFVALLKRSLGEPCGVATNFCFFWYGVGLIEGVPTVAAWMD